jgi:hypothetical protein
MDKNNLLKNKKLMVRIGQREKMPHEKGNRLHIFWKELHCLKANVSQKLDNRCSYRQDEAAVIVHEWLKGRRQAVAPLRISGILFSDFS